MLSALLAAACLAASPGAAAEPDAGAASIPVLAADEDRAVATGSYEDALAAHKGRYELNPTPANAYLFARIDYDRVRARGVVHRALKAGSSLAGLRWLRTLFRAEDLAAAGRHEAALAEIDASPDWRELDTMMASKARISLLLAMGRLDEAERAAWAEADWSEPGLHSLRIGVRFLQGDMREVDALTALPPDAAPHAYALSARASYLARIGKRTQARELWKRIVQSPRDFYGWDEAKMDALSLLGHGNAAAVQAAAVLALDPGSDSARAQLAAHDLEFGRVERAEKLAREALAKNPRSIPALGLVGSLEFRHGRYRDALLLNDRALDLAPGLVELWVARAAIHSHMGSRDLQRRSMERAARINPAHPYYLHESARMHMDAGEWEKALAAFTILLAQEEPGFDEYRGFGRCSVGSNRLEQGLAALERAKELADTAERKKAVDKDVAWANGFLQETSERYPRDAAAAVVKLKPARYLDDAPLAVYREGSRLAVGTPWGKVVSRWTTEGNASRRTRWAPGGTGVYALVNNRIDFLDLKTGSTRTIVAELPAHTAFSDAFPESRYFETFAFSPNGKHLYVLSREKKRGRDVAKALLDYTAEDKAPRVLLSREEIAFLQADPVSGRLLISGGGNLRMDLAAGTTVEFPIVGCHTDDLDYSPGGERLACVAMDAKGPEAKEILLYDIATRKKVPLEIAGKGAAWSPDGQFLAYVWRGRQLRVLELKTGKVTAYDIAHRRDHLLPSASPGGTGTRWSADGRFIHCTLGGDLTTLIVDRRDKTAWTKAGAYDEFEWSPAKP